jgi:hypothetical protein
MPDVTKKDQDVRKGAVEGVHPGEPGHGNANAPALDENGLPDDLVAITEDVLGANEDDSQG